MPSGFSTCFAFLYLFSRFSCFVTSLFSACFCVYSAIFDATTKNKPENTISTHPPPVLVGESSGEIPGRRGGNNSGAGFFFSSFFFRKIFTSPRKNSKDFCHQKTKPGLKNSLIFIIILFSFLFHFWFVFLLVRFFVRFFLGDEHLTKKTFYLFFCSFLQSNHATSTPVPPAGFSGDLHVTSLFLYHLAGFSSCSAFSLAAPRFL